MLWYHPDRTPGSADLPRDRMAALVRSLFVALTDDEVRVERASSRVPPFTTTSHRRTRLFVALMDE